ncbi:MAG TPA: ATP-binding cassette domain-containing protein, partial [Limnochordia bacterium]
GYIGPNGAGKSTTIKLLSGILHPTQGEIRVAGLDPRRERRALARRIGVVFGQRTQLWWDLPLIDSYQLLAAMYRIPPDQFRRRLDELAGLLEVDGFLDTPVRKLSLGQRMRADLVGALLHMPPVLFLDEPTIGLDVVAKRRIRAFLQTLKRQGVTVLLTTHDLHDIEQLCERVIVIDRGELIFDGSVPALKEQLGGETRLTVLVGEAGSLEEDAAIRQRIAQAGFRMVGWDEGRLIVQFNRARLSAGAAVERLGRIIPIRDLYLTEPQLEEVIEKLYLGGVQPVRQQRVARD